MEVSAGRDRKNMAQLEPLYSEIIHQLDECLQKKGGASWNFISNGRMKSCQLI